MILSESLVWALEDYDISGIKVMCKASISEDVAQTFLNAFSNGWKEALLKVEQIYGDCVPIAIPAEIVKKDYGFFISIGALDIRYASGDYYDAQYGFDALDNALENMKIAFPQVEYEGYICGIHSDLRAGEAYQLEVTNTGNVSVFDFVGEILGNIFATEMYVPEEPLDASDMNFVVAGKLKFFENREEITEYIEDLGGNVTSSISKKTNYLISNDLNATTSKNAKAKELGIPIINEAEFITTFCDPGEFDLEQSEFWDSFAQELECYEDFDEAIKSLYAYSEWIKKADLDRAVRAIIRIAGEYDEDVQEELVELVEKIESGEYLNEEDEQDADEDQLPDGYMEALEMFMMAEEISGITPLPSEVVSSKGTFDIVIAKAESGDANAKLTAGKYFIADHVEGETKRAIQWIREAADAGVEEARKYIENNQKLFK